MIITRYKKPRENYPSFRRSDLFNELLNSFDNISTNTNVVDFNPSVNTREGKEAYHIELDLPGIKKEDIDLDIQNNTLTISGKRELKEQTNKEDYYKVESAYGSFYRSFTLPENIDIENIKANSKNGVLEITIPKLKVIPNKIKKIKIK